MPIFPYKIIYYDEIKIIVCFQKITLYHPFNGWFDIAPIRGMLLATPKGVVSQAFVTCLP